jgi:hypothetical protein
MVQRSWMHGVWFLQQSAVIIFLKNAHLEEILRHVICILSELGLMIRTYAKQSP